MYTPTAVTTMSKHEAKTKVVPFDDAGEIQVVPIDTIVDDGGHDLEADESRRNQTQNFCEYRRAPRFCTGLRILTRTPLV